MNFRSSHQVFKTNKKYFWIYSIFKNIDFSQISKFLYNNFYSKNKYKNKSYDPSSLLRLYFILESVIDKNNFNSRVDISNIDSDILNLCGFSEDLPSYSTFFYFKKRIPLTTLFMYLNKIRIAFIKVLFKKFASNKSKKNETIVFSVDSKPVAIYGKNLPLGTIHSYNECLNGKLGIKVHHISIIYPFYFPLVFYFTPGHYHDSPIFRKMFSLIEELISSLNKLGYISFFTGDSAYGGIENYHMVSKIQAIPVLKAKSNSIDMNKFSIEDDKIYCIYNRRPLHKNGKEKSTGRLNFKCYKPECNFKETCSKKLWLRNLDDLKSSTENILIHKLRFEICQSELFDYIYRLRPRIEHIHGIWTKQLKLKNIFYCANYNELLNLELKIMSNSTEHFLLNSIKSPLKYFHLI